MGGGGVVRKKTITTQMCGRPSPGGVPQKASCCGSSLFCAPPISDLQPPLLRAHLRGRSLSGPILRDAARLFQRYPPVVRYRVLGVST